MVSTSPENESSFIYPESEADDGIYSNKNASTSYWVSVGNPNGYALDANADISILKSNLNNPAPAISAMVNIDFVKSIRQIRWVIKTEGFNGEFEYNDGNVNLSFTDEEAPKYFPVPAGLRMNIDADPEQAGVQVL